MWTSAMVFLPCMLAACVAGKQCSPASHSSMAITVLSRRNETGHWTAQLRSRPSRPRTAIPHPCREGTSTTGRTLPAGMQQGCQILGSSGQLLLASEIAVVTSRKNLNFTHDSDLENRRSSGPWRVDFNQTTSACELGETVLIVATLTSVPVAAEGNKSADRKSDGSQYVVVDGLGEYKLHTNPKTWEDARKKCTNEDGHLAIINTEAEAKALLKIWQQNTRLTNYFVFLGFNDLNGEGHYVTVKGERMEDTGYNDWEKGQPDNSRGENCGGINRSGKLHDLSCTTKIPFFCEKDPPSN